MTEPKRVLVVDDNVDSANCLRLLLNLKGCVVEVAHNGLAAVEMAAQFNPDVIFLDIGLPKLCGFDACRQIRALPGGERIVIVALSGWSRNEDYERSAEAGFTRHLVKPIDFDCVENLLNLSP